MENLSPKDWVEYVGKKEVRDVMATVLSPEQVDELLDFGLYMNSAAAVEAGKGMIGQIMGPVTLAHALQGSLKAMTNIVRYGILSSMLTSNTFGRAVLRMKNVKPGTLDPRIAEGIIRLHVNSPEYLRFLAESSTDEKEMQAIVSELQEAGLMNPPEQQ
jgi:hypothetical protein